MLKQPKKYYRGVWGKGRDRRKKSGFHREWLWLATKNISLLSEVNATNKLFTTIPIFLMNAKLNLLPINFHGNTAAKNAING